MVFGDCPNRRKPPQTAFDLPQSCPKLGGVAGYYDCGQSAEHRAAETQLILALVPPDCRARIIAGLDMLAEEFSS